MKYTYEIKFLKSNRFQTPQSLNNENIPIETKIYTHIFDPSNLNTITRIVLGRFMTCTDMLLIYSFVCT